MATATVIIMATHTTAQETVTLIMVKSFFSIFPMFLISIRSRFCAAFISLSFYREKTANVRRRIKLRRRNFFRRALERTKAL
jgi:hypothetical protein